MSESMYYASATDECGDYVSLELEASSKTEAWDLFADMYPDCRIMNVLEHQEMMSVEQRRYQRVIDDYDLDWDGE